MIKIYVDGACASHTTKRGGWGWYCENNGVESIASGHCESSTNNQMELVAAIEALNAVIEPQHVHIISDSEYVVSGITIWIQKWKINRWKSVTKGRKNIKNKELWMRLDEAVARHPEVTWEWVSAHSGVRGNEAANLLAQAEAGTTK